MAPSTCGTVPPMSTADIGSALPPASIPILMNTICPMMPIRETVGPTAARPPARQDWVRLRGIAWPPGNCGYGSEISAGQTCQTPSHAPRMRQTAAVRQAPSAVEWWPTWMARQWPKLGRMLAHGALRQSIALQEGPAWRPFSPNQQDGSRQGGVKAHPRQTRAPRTLCIRIKKKD